MLDYLAQPAFVIVKPVKIICGADVFMAAEHAAVMA
jgi:hypothetical protein